MTKSVESFGATLKEDINMETEKENVEVGLKPTNEDKNESQNGEIQNSSEEEKLKEKLAQSENQYLRLLADYQNLQKRTAQEKEEIYKYAAIKTIEILLPGLDTFDYAKQAIKPDSSVEKLSKDFSLVFDTLLRCLKEVGLETIEETGILFDPVYHEPIQQIPTNELPEHTVMQVLKKGYMLNKKVIRPASVVVSVKEKEEIPNKDLGQG